MIDLSQGVYGVSEAARYSSVPARELRRWLLGYSSRRHGVRTQYPPVLDSPYRGTRAEGVASLGDLIEVRFVHAFRRAGISLQTIRMAAQRARERFGTRHPFSMRRFRTDGRTLFVDVANEIGEVELLDILKNQMAFRKILSPYLYEGIEFAGDESVRRWWPLKKEGGIVFDPVRSFGQPILDAYAVPTRTLYDAFRGNGSVRDVAHIFEIPERHVIAAVEYERALAA